MSRSEAVNGRELFARQHEDALAGCAAAVTFSEDLGQFANGKPDCESASDEADALERLRRKQPVSRRRRSGATASRFKMASKITPEVSPRNGSVPVYLAPSVGGLIGLRAGSDCQKATGARLESVQNSANSQRHRFRKNPNFRGVFQLQRWVHRCRNLHPIESIRLLMGQH